jgi:hypothetical protein
MISPSIVKAHDEALSSMVYPRERQCPTSHSIMAPEKYRMSSLGKEGQTRSSRNVVAHNVVLTAQVGGGVVDPGGLWLVERQSRERQRSKEARTWAGRGI